MGLGVVIFKVESSGVEEWAGNGANYRWDKYSWRGEGNWQRKEGGDTRNDALGKGRQRAAQQLWMGYGGGRKPNKGTGGAGEDPEESGDATGGGALGGRIMTMSPCCEYRYGWPRPPDRSAGKAA